MYYQQKPPKEPSGCMQTIIISRLVMGILFVPILIVIGAILLIMLAFYALSIHPLLALLVVAIGAVIIVAVARWEGRRVEKERAHYEE